MEEFTPDNLIMIKMMKLQLLKQMRYDEAAKFVEVEKIIYKAIQEKYTQEIINNLKEKP